MNSPLMRWLLQVDAIPAGADAVRLGWERPLPAWGWALVIAAIVGVCLLSYSRLRAPRPARITLAVLRGLLLLVLATLVSGPLLIQPREQVERDWVLMLVDRSASLQIEDAAAAQGRRISRDESLRRGLAAGRATLDALAAERTVVWLGFDGGAFDLAAETAAEGAPVALPAADGQRTRLDAALDQALQRAAARPLAGVVVFSDGRTSEPPSRSTVRRIQAEAAPVMVVPLGSDEPLGDLALRRTSAPQRAFVRDFVPVVVEVDRLGTAARAMPAVVRLLDAATGEELDRADVPEGGETATITLTGRSDDAGEADWSVVIEPAGIDLVAGNNRAELRIGLVDRPLRVLYVEGYPRWEYRYLKNLLVREESVESSVMLVSADRDFAQEGNMPLARLPRTTEEFAEFDLFVIGDVPAGFFTPEQLAHMRDAVAERGAGLLWIGGPESTPSEWGGSALADLLPVRPPLDLPAMGEPVNMLATPLAARLGVLQLAAEDGAAEGWPPELADASAGWSRLQYAQRIDPGQLKPATEVLAETAQATSGGPAPLVMAMRYGAGQVIYVASDEIWRWRFGRGEVLPERFWLQLVRMLARERVAGGDEALELVVEPRRVEPGQPVQVLLRIEDAALAAAGLASVGAVVESPDGERIADIDLRPDARGGEYSATWAPEAAGEWIVRVRDPALPEASGLAAAFEVIQPDEERRRPETDHALLAALAAETGGKVVALEDLTPLATLPRREIRTEDPITERIWNTPLALLLVVLLAGLEWAGRRAVNLL